MEIRTANEGDRPAIRDVARRSLQASYSLSPEAITTAVSEWYDEAGLSETMADDDKLLLVAVQDDQVVGFAESELSSSGEDATLLWLHVDPAHRGENIGTDLFEQTRERLSDAGADRMVGRVLGDNLDGNSFYESQGFEQIRQDEVEIAGHTYFENIYAESTDHELQSVKAPDAATVYVDEDDWDDGSVGKFFTVYSDEAASNLYGYFCANCNQLANSMDAMGRIECDNCGNARKPTRWDAAYL